MLERVAGRDVEVRRVVDANQPEERRLCYVVVSEIRQIAF